MSTETQLAPSMWEKPVSKLYRINFWLIRNDESWAIKSWHVMDVKITENQATVMWSESWTQKKNKNFYYDNDNMWYRSTPELALQWFKRAADNSEQSWDRSPNQMKLVRNAEKWFEENMPK